MTYVLGERINSFNIQGSTVIRIDELARILDLVHEWDGTRRLVSVRTVQ